MISFKKFLTEIEEHKNFYEHPDDFDSHYTDADDELHNELSHHYTKIPDNKETGNYCKTPGVPYKKTGHYYDDLKAIKKYTDSSSALNAALWNKHTKNKGANVENDDKIIKERVPHLDRIMNYHKTPKDLTLYSGTKIDPRKKMNSEKIVQHPAYMSTSLDRRTARSFARKHKEYSEDMSKNVDAPKEAYEHTLHIHVPKGSPGAYIDRASDIGGEKEFVLPRNTKLKYMHTDTKEIPNDDWDNKRKIFSHSHHMQVLPESDNK